MNSRSAVGEPTQAVVNDTASFHISRPPVEAIFVPPGFSDPSCSRFRSKPTRLMSVLTRSSSTQASTRSPYWALSSVMVSVGRVGLTRAWAISWARTTRASGVFASGTRISFVA
jgi:hypothetical protein